MFAETTSVAMVGADPKAVRIEVHVGKPQDSFLLVGLPDTAIREAKERVRAAIISTGKDFPHRRVTVNLSPADLPKAGSDYDLPIALGVMAAAGEISLTRVVAAGELSLDGAVRRSRTAIGAALLAARRRLPCVVAEADAAVAAQVPGAVVYPVGSLAEAAAVVSGWQPARAAAAQLPPLPEPADDLAEVRGQPVARRALEIAAAGGHHLLMVGSPGAGKTMLARRLPGILPELTPQQAYESLLRSRIVPTVGTVNRKRVSAALVRFWVAAMTDEGLSAARIHQALRVVRQSLGVAVDDGLIVRNPAAKVKLPRVEKRRQRFLSAFELSRLADECGDYWPFVWFLGWSGLRLGEAVALRVDKVDVDSRRVLVVESATEIDGHLTFGPTKTHETRTVILPRLAIGRLELDGKAEDPFVFTAPRGGPYGSTTSVGACLPRLRGGSGSPISSSMT